MNTLLITGANRGLGLEFVRQYAQEDVKIYACCRDPHSAAELQSLAKEANNITIEALDVAQSTAIEVLAQKIKQPIDILINNAGFLKADTLDTVETDALMQSYLINAVSPLMIMRAFRKQVAASEHKLMVAISSSMGSLTENTSGGYYSYRASKAALNMLMKSASIDLAKDHIKVLVLHPGWVKTRMGGEAADITPEVSINGMRKVIAEFKKQNQIKLIRYNGQEIAW